MSHEQSRSQPRPTEEENRKKKAKQRCDATTDGDSEEYKKLLPSIKQLDRKRRRQILKVLGQGLKMPSKRQCSLDERMLVRALPARDPQMALENREVLRHLLREYFFAILSDRINERFESSYKLDESAVEQVWQLLRSPDWTHSNISEFLTRNIDRSVSTEVAVDSFLKVYGDCWQEALTEIVVKVQSKVRIASFSVELALLLRESLPAVVSVDGKS